MPQSFGGEVDATATIRKYSHLPIDQVEFIPVATRDTIQSIENGIVFLIAFWSIPAMNAFAFVTSQLAKIDNQNTRLTVVDTDGATALGEFPELAKWLVAGNGITAWVRDGAIAEVTLPLSDPNRIGELAQEFFPT